MLLLQNKANQLAAQETVNLGSTCGYYAVSAEQPTLEFRKIPMAVDEATEMAEVASLVFHKEPAVPEPEVLREPITGWAQQAESRSPVCPTEVLAAMKIAAQDKLAEAAKETARLRDLRWGYTLGDQESEKWCRQMLATRSRAYAAAIVDKLVGRKPRKAAKAEPIVAEPMAKVIQMPAREVAAKPLAKPKTVSPQATQPKAINSQAAQPKVVSSQVVSSQAAKPSAKPKAVKIARPPVSPTVGKKPVKINAKLDQQLARMAGIL